MTDVYNRELHTDDKIALIESFDTHYHRLRLGKVDSIGIDGRGEYAMLVVDGGFFDELRFEEIAKLFDAGLSSYMKKCYITHKCVVKI